MKDGPFENEPAHHALTVIALGDPGELNGTYRASAFYISDMYSGRHDAGKPDLLLFLGDNFIPLGLNIRADDVDGTEKDLLRPLNDVFSTVSRDRVHAIPGEHDYYSRFAEENTSFFGLLKNGAGPTGLSDKGIIREAAISAWTFHANLPGQSVVPLYSGSPDSVQFIFFDSALPLRSDPSHWRDALAALGHILRSSKESTGIVWRVLCTHHPWYSVGEHGGYSIWDDERNLVEYLPNCDRDSNAAGFIRNWIDPEDLCADRYRQYTDSVKAIVKAGGVKINLLLAAHDRSLQLLWYPDHDPDCEDCPKIHIISGAGSLPAMVKLPSPPAEFTSAQGNPQSEGVSPPGFVQLRFERERIRVVFFDARNGKVLDMGGGGTGVFWIDKKSVVHTEFGRE